MYTEQATNGERVAYTCSIIGAFRVYWNLN